MNNFERTLPEGYYNSQYHTYLHYIENDWMDCNPKSYKYILQIEKEIDRLNKEISRIMEIIDLNLYNYGYQIKEDIEITSGSDKE